MNNKVDENKSRNNHMKSDDFGSTSTNIINNIKDIYCTIDLISRNKNKKIVL